MSSGFQKPPGCTPRDPTLTPIAYRSRCWRRVVLVRLVQLQKACSQVMLLVRVLLLRHIEHLGGTGTRLSVGRALN